MSMQSGRETLAEIDSSLRKARGDLDKLDAQFNRARSAMAELRRAELGLYARLARVRLLAIEQGELVDRLSIADREVERLLAEREAAAERLSEDQTAADRKLGELEEQRSAQQAVVARASEAVDAVEAKAQAALAADPAYRAQLDRTKQADFTADQAEEKAAAAQRDRLEKGKPYEDDPLFSYLWARHYGTSAYRAWPLTRALDGWVARLCSFEAARRNYSVLIEIPERLTEHAAGMRSRFEDEAEALRKLEQTAAEAAGVPPLQADLDAAEEALAAIDASIAEQEQKIHALVEERARHAAGEDDLYRRCLTVLSESLQRESIQYLREGAARTLDREDDEVVERLVALADERERLDRDLDEFQRLHAAQSQRVRELEDLRHRFKAAGYDDRYSEFSNGALIGMILGQLLSGSARGRDVWRVIERQQRRSRAHADPGFGSLKFPRAPKPGPWRMPRGGGFRGGGFKTGGGFGRGGGFKTGGGF